MEYKALVLCQRKFGKKDFRPETVLEAESYIKSMIHQKFIKNAGDTIKIEYMTPGIINNSRDDIMDYRMNFGDMSDYKFLDFLTTHKSQYAVIFIAYCPLNLISKPFITADIIKYFNDILIKDGFVVIGHTLLNEKEEIKETINIHLLKVHFNEITPDMTFQKKGNGVFKSYFSSEIIEYPPDIQALIYTNYILGKSFDFRYNDEIHTISFTVPPTFLPDSGKLILFK